MGADTPLWPYIGSAVAAAGLLFAAGACVTEYLCARDREPRKREREVRRQKARERAKRIAQEMRLRDDPRVQGITTDAVPGD